MFYCMFYFTCDHSLRLSTDVCCSDDGSLGSRDSDPFFEFHHFDDEDFEVIIIVQSEI